LCTKTSIVLFALLKALLLGCETGLALFKSDHLVLFLINIRAQTIKGPDNPTSQLLPIMSKKRCTGDGGGRKDKGGGGGKMVCDKDGVVEDGVRQNCV